MKPRYLGVLIMIISVFVIGALFYFDYYLNQEVLEHCLEFCESVGDVSCSFESCPFYEEHNHNERLIFGMGLLVAFLAGIGFYLFFTKTENLIEQKKYDLSKLKKEEKNVFLFIKENKEKGVYQSNIVEEFNFPKSKVTRILDKLQRDELIERKRRGMTNIIFLK